MVTNKEKRDKWREYARRDYVKEKRSRYMKEWRKREGKKEHLAKLMRKYNKEGRYKRTAKNCVLKKRYGINIEDYDKIIRRQDGKCDICGIILEEIKKKKRHLDHNHKTSLVRGILCNRCNMLIGACNENEKILEEAIKYLKKYQYDKDK